MALFKGFGGAALGKLGTRLEKYAEWVGESGPGKAAIERLTEQGMKGPRAALIEEMMKDPMNAKMLKTPEQINDAVTRMSGYGTALGDAQKRAQGMVRTGAIAAPGAALGIMGAGAISGRSSGGRGGPSAKSSGGYTGITA